ncbi:DUF4406 domain-containing protein [Vibrio harveyi]|uniref:DUF4406 domain-containing protein n=1 Tax=Vibrio harveyi TaxID=669 RepID=UPI003BB64750
MKIYIAGGVTGSTQAPGSFLRAALKIQAVGHIPLHTQVLPEGLSENAYMDIAFAMVRECDAIYCLPDWEDSDGAIAEVAYAKKLHLPIFTNVAEIRNLLKF